MIKGSQYLYEKHGLTNQDIKPSNIMIDEDGNLKIIDLGMVHDVNTNVFPNGTPSFISPIKYSLI